MLLDSPSSAQKHKFVYCSVYRMDLFPIVLAYLLIGEWRFADVCWEVRGFEVGDR